jgi:hypothetical protein
MNMHIKRVLFERVAFSPNPVEHLLAREYAARRFEELLQNLEFLWSQIDGMAVDQDFMTSEVHPKISCAKLDVRLDAGLSASKDGAHPRDKLTNTLAAHDQINILIIFFETFLVVAGYGSLLHRDDRNPVQYFHPPEFRDGGGATVKNN